VAPEAKLGRSVLAWRRRESVGLSHQFFPQGRAQATFGVMACEGVRMPKPDNHPIDLHFSVV
jgi:hypothetical protein